MVRRVWPLVVLACLEQGGLAVPVPSVRGDEFERIEGEVLAGLVRSSGVRAHQRLTLAEIEALPNLLRESRSALLVVRTDQGNITRMLVSLALRKAPGAAGAGGGASAAVPVLVLERFDTFDAGNLATRLARGRDLILFAGFQVDLDSGQVVPENQGGDLRFVVGGAGGSGLEVDVVGEARLYTVAKLPRLESAGVAEARPSIGRSVLPGDFAGRYRLFANGQWSGTLDLAIGAEGEVSGRFRSDFNGAAYPVSGRVGLPDAPPNKIEFAVKLPRTVQEFEGLLWTEGKGAMAGTLTMIGRAYGFFAIREAGRFAPEGEDVGPLTAERLAGMPGRRTVVARKGQYTLDGQPRTDQELTDALKRAVAAEPASWVLLQAPDDEPFAAIQRAFEVISAAGIRTIRLAGAEAAD